MLPASAKDAAIAVTALSRYELERIEVLVNGKVVRLLEPGRSKSEVKGSFRIPIPDGDWIAARCFERNAQTIRFAPPARFMWGRRRDATRKPLRTSTNGSTPTPRRSAPRRQRR